MKGTLIRYKAAADRAEENQQLIENAFAELHQKRPDGVRYMVLRLADATFVHFVARSPDRTSAITDLGAFKTFQQGIKERTVEAPQSNEATLVGNYGMLRD